MWLSTVLGSQQGTQGQTVQADWAHRGHHLRGGSHWSTVVALVPPASTWLLPVPASSSCPTATLLIPLAHIIRSLPSQRPSQTQWRVRIQVSTSDLTSVDSCRSHQGWKGFVYVKILKQL